MSALGMFVVSCVFLVRHSYCTRSIKCYPAGLCSTPLVQQRVRAAKHAHRPSSSCRCGSSQIQAGTRRICGGDSLLPPQRRFLQCTATCCNAGALHRRWVQHCQPCRYCQDLASSSIMSIPALLSSCYHVRSIGTPGEYLRQTLSNI